MIGAVALTIPKDKWACWVEEADTGTTTVKFGYDYHHYPAFDEGCRVYIVAHGRLRCYMTLKGTVSLQGLLLLGLEGPVVGVTLDEPVRGFQGTRRPWWYTSQERAFTEWRTP